MREELIGFEVAKLAKEKGFDWLCNGFYDLYDNPHNNKITYSSPDNWNLYKSLSAPSQSLLQRWLREVHNFHITICNTNPGDKVDFKFSMGELYKSDNDDSKKYIVLGSKGTFKTYEEALEIGLQESLKLIKNEKL